MIGTLDNAFLLGLPETVQSQLKSSLEPVSFQAGTDLYLPDAAVDWIYFPVAGLVSFGSLLEIDDQADAAIIGREGVVGLFEAAGSGRMPCRALVQIDLSAVRMPAKRFVELVDQNEAFRRAVFLHAETTMAEMREAVACRSRHRLQARLASWLITYQARSGYETLHLSQEFLAAILGVQRTTVSAAAADLKTGGRIKSARGAIRIGDRAGLQRVACGCYAVRTDHERRFEAWAQDRISPAPGKQMSRPIREETDWPAGLSRRHAPASIPRTEAPSPAAR